MKLPRIKDTTLHPQWDILGWGSTVQNITKLETQQQVICQLKVPNKINIGLEQKRKVKPSKENKFSME